MQPFLHFRYVVHTDKFIPMHDDPRAGWYGHTLAGSVWYENEEAALTELRRAYACNKGNKNWMFGCKASVPTITRYFAKRGYTVKLESKVL